jgi:ADP-ribose pyrophosphatase
MKVMPSYNWTIVSSKYIVNDPWVKIRADTCRLPNGRVISPYYVYEHKPWVTIVALTPDHEVVMINQYRHGAGRIILELPGGTLDGRDSDPAQAARRELLEETGYSGTQFKAIGQVSADPASHTNLTHCFLVTGAVPTAGQQLDDTEEIDVVLVPLDEAVQLAADGKILQALHVSALFFALHTLGKIGTGQSGIGKQPFS